MRALTPIVLVLATILLNGGAAGAQSQPRADEHRALRAQLQRDYDLVPLTDGVALRPKERGDVRLVEVTAGAVLVNGAAVTGRELRDRLGDHADAVLRLSYLPADELRAFGAPPAPPAPAAAPQAPEPPLERDQPDPRDRRPERDSREFSRVSRGDRVQNLRQRRRGPRRADRWAGGRGVRFGPGQWQGGRPGGRGHGLGGARRGCDRGWGCGVGGRPGGAHCRSPDQRRRHGSRAERLQLPDPLPRMARATGSTGRSFRSARCRG